MPPSPLHLGAFTDDLGCGQRAAADDGQQRRCNDRDAFGDLGGQLVDLDGEHPQVFDEPQGIVKLLALVWCCQPDNRGSDVQDSTQMACLSRALWVS
jgi:hypothetical protein